MFIIVLLTLYHVFLWLKNPEEGMEKSQTSVWLKWSPTLPAPEDTRATESHTVVLVYCCFHVRIAD